MDVAANLARLDELVGRAETLTRAMIDPDVDLAGVGGPGVLRASPWAGWPDDWQTPLMQPFSAPPGFGYGRLDPAGYMTRVSTVMTCADVNSQQLAAMPVYETDQSLERFRPPRWANNPEPEHYTDWSQFMVEYANSVQLCGEAFLYATRRGPELVTGFIVLDSTRVRVRRVAGAKRYSLADPDHPGDPTRETPLDAADVLHVPYVTAPGRLRGIGPLEWTARNLVAADALETYATDIAEHGLWALLTTDANLDAPQRDAARDNFQAARRRGKGAPAVLSGGWQFQPLNLSPADMAMLDLLSFNERAIAAAMGVPGELIGLDAAGGSMTYRNAESLYDFHWRSKLRTLANRLMRPLSGWALPENVRLELDRDEYVRPAFETRVGAYETMHGIVDPDGTRAMDVAEIRRRERMGRATRPATPTPAEEG